MHIRNLTLCMALIAQPALAQDAIDPEGLPPAFGAAALQAFWQYPAFDPQQRAFYYVRVLEIPMPRWTTYDARAFGVEIPQGAPAEIQERAYTSPVWYNPAS